MEKKGETKEQTKTTTYKAFSVDLNAPCSHNLLTVESAQKYLQSSFKVNGLRLRETKEEQKENQTRIIDLLKYQQLKKATKEKILLLSKLIINLNSLKDILNILLKNS